MGITDVIGHGREIRISNNLLDKARRDMPETEIHPEIVNPQREYGQHNAVYIEIRHPSDFDIERNEPPKLEYESRIIDMN